MKKKIAFIISLNNSAKGGLFFATTNRIKSFIVNNPDFDVTVFNLTFKMPFIIQVFKKLFLKSNELQKEFITINDLKCQNLWLDEITIFSYIHSKIYNQPQPSFSVYACRFVEKFSNFSLIAAHFGNGPGEFACEIARLTDKPYIITYHGTDIHTTPFRSEEKRALYKKLLSQSSANIFVSKGLLRKSTEIYKNVNKNYVIYNGIDINKFKRANENEINQLKILLGIEGKVIAFAGNLIDVKNVLVLPAIFEQIRKLYCGNISFLIIGDGSLQKSVKKKAKSLNLEIIFTGRIENDQMPLFYSLIDVLVLPSKNEGMPLVLAEAISCGAYCVGSRTGGIPEVIGDENCFDLDENFVEKISNRIIYLLECQPIHRKSDFEMDMKANSITEGEIYRNILRENTDI